MSLMSVASSTPGKEAMMSDVIATSVNHPPISTFIYHSQGALKVFWFTNLSWHITGFVTTQCL